MPVLLSFTRSVLTLHRVEQILNRLVLLYFASDTVDNHELRQCLSYFFPVYCYSNAANQRRVSNVRPFPPSHSR
jgi:hypothetical protein